MSNYINTEQIFNCLSTLSDTVHGLRESLATLNGLIHPTGNATTDTTFNTEITSGAGGNLSIQGGQMIFTDNAGKKYTVNTTQVSG